MYVHSEKKKLISAESQTVRSLAIPRFVRVSALVYLIVEFLVDFERHQDASAEVSFVRCVLEALEIHWTAAGNKGFRAG